MRYPSVTQVLSVYQDFTQIGALRLENAANRGTEVHRICAAIARGLWWSPEIAGDQRGYVQSFERWFDVAVDQVIFVEDRLECACHGYCGHPDLIAILRADSGATVIDLKTPVVEGSVWRGQLAAYRHLADCAGFGLPVERQGALMLSPTGGPAKFKEYTANKEDFAAFLAALTAYRYFKKG